MNIKENLRYGIHKGWIMMPKTSPLKEDQWYYASDNNGEFPISGNGDCLLQQVFLNKREDILIYPIYYILSFNNHFSSFKKRNNLYNWYKSYGIADRIYFADAIFIPTKEFFLEYNFYN